jgi:hypothetical protein
MVEEEAKKDTSMEQAASRASESLPAVRRNILPPTSWWKRKPKRPAWSRQQAEPVKVYRRFGGTYHLQLHGGRSQERHQHEAGCAFFLLHVVFLFV